MTSTDFEYDVFISYSVSDKISIVTELVDKLKESGIKVWYAGQELGPGKRIYETIREGLVSSRHGLLIVSPNYLLSEWTRREFHALWAREDYKNRLIFTVWHNTSVADIKKFDAMLSDNFAIHSSKGNDYIVETLVKAINDCKKGNSGRIIKVPKPQKTLAVSIPLIILIMLACMGFYYFNQDLPTNTLIESTISDRIQNQNLDLINDIKANIKAQKIQSASQSHISNIFNTYMNLKAQYRNLYYFNTSYNHYEHKKYVEPAVALDLENLAPFNNYTFDAPDIYVSDKRLNPPAMDVEYIYVNNAPTEFEISGEIQQDDQTYLVYVDYENNIRNLSVHLTYSPATDWTKKRQTTIWGMEPHETYVFKKQHNEWVFSGIE